MERVFPFYLSGEGPFLGMVAWMLVMAGLNAVCLAIYTLAVAEAVRWVFGW